MRKTNVSELNELLRKFELKRSGNKKKKAEYLLQYVDWDRLQPALPQESEAKAKGKARRARGRNCTIDAMLESQDVEPQAEPPTPTKR